MSNQEKERAKRERKAQREAERNKRRRERLESHAVGCPHCGKSVLDHMTKCPYCGGALTPSGGYAPMSDEQRKKIRTVMWIVLSVVAVGALLLVYFLR